MFGQGLLLFLQLLLWLGLTNYLTGTEAFGYTSTKGLAGAPLRVRSCRDLAPNREVSYSLGLFGESSSSLVSMRSQNMVLFQGDKNDESTSSERSVGSGQKGVYGDDAFGFVSLTSGLILKDYTFAAIFALSSGIAAGVTLTSKLQVSPLLPGWIAIGSFVLRILVLITGISPFDAPSQTDLLVEAVISSISLLVGYYAKTKDQP
mmetsp:Transcript_1289/g.2309  ORF Transcript_1289/g.2309 Transcript_1289/m.2309 type:complete len:205 (-) Transcript_1289:53-667(-)